MTQTQNMSRTLSLPMRPLPPAPLVTKEEVESRISRVRAEMVRAEIDAIVLTDPKNIQYVTGYQHPFVDDKTCTPQAVITLERVLVTMSGYTHGDRAPAAEPRAFSVVPYDYGKMARGVTALVQQISALPTAERKHIAVDYGEDMWGYGSLELIERLSSLSSNGVLKSADQVLWRVRMIKTPFEAAVKKVAFEIVNRAFDATVVNAYAGMTELEFYQMLQAQIFLNGAERTDPFAVLFSNDSFPYGRAPSNRNLTEGHYIWTDMYASYGGYHADQNRTARCGEPADWEIDTYERVRSVTLEVANSIKPGLRVCEVYGIYQHLWREAGLGATFGVVSRIGHGGGLDVVEPPSISATDETVIEPGMILHFEPKLEQDGAVFQTEEAVYVREDGVEFLSVISPERLPVIEAVSNR